MALVLGNILFLHIPRTGGTWVREVLNTISQGFSIPLQEAYGDPVFNVNGPLFASPEESETLWWKQHSIPRESEIGELVPFTVVRDEDSWLRSYYNYQMQTESWTPGRLLDEIASGGEQSCENFVRAVKAAKPGFVPTLMHAYVTAYPRVAAIRTENLPEQLPQFLHLVGIPLPPPEAWPGPRNATKDKEES